MEQKVYCNDCKYLAWEREQPLMSAVMISDRCSHPDCIYYINTTNCKIKNMETTYKYNMWNECPKFKKATLLDILLRPFKYIFAPWT